MNLKNMGSKKAFIKTIGIHELWSFLEKTHWIHPKILRIEVDVSSIGSFKKVLQIIISMACRCEYMMEARVLINRKVVGKDSNIGRLYQGNSTWQKAKLLNYIISSIEISIFT